MITDILKNSLITLNCDRAIIAKTHSSNNMEVNSDYFSIIFEQLKTGVNPINKLVQSKPCSILDKEFGGRKDFISIGNKLNITQKHCLDHLNDLNVEVIINQLLYNDIEIWGVLSFQYLKCPNYLNIDILEEKYLNVIKKYKLELMEGLNGFY